MYDLGDDDLDGSRKAKVEQEPQKTKQARNLKALVDALSLWHSSACSTQMGSMYVAACRCRCCDKRLAQHTEHVARRVQCVRLVAYHNSRSCLVYFVVFCCLEFRSGSWLACLGVYMS